MEKKKVAVVALVVFFIVVISVIVITRNLDKNASTEVALVYEDVATKEEEIELEVSAEVEAIEESEVVEEESTEEIPVAVEESEAIEEAPIVEEVKSIYTDVNYIRYAKTSLNVRQGLGTDTEKIGSLTQNQEVTVIGEVSDSDWVLISYASGEEGHVNKSYLSETKVVVTSKPKESSTTTPSQGSTTDNSNQTTQPTDNSSQTPSTSSGSGQSSTGDPLMDFILNGGDTSQGEESPDGMYIHDWID